LNIIIALSWFHRKIGPMIFYSYPEGTLKEDEKIRIADQIDQAFEEGFFSHSFDTIISLNYYFEIYSKWARGQKEMLMVSIIFDENVTTQIEHEVLGQCIEFSKKLKMNNEIYKAFYLEEDIDYSINPEVKSYNETLKIWIKELYWTLIEKTREKSEEEISANLLNNVAIYELINILSNGPLSIEDLKYWFTNEFPHEDFDNILNKLEKERIIFKNDIGVENYVLLTKQISVERIPPLCIISLFEEKPQLEELTKIFLQKVQNFFNKYVPTQEDSQILINLVANSKIYNLLCQLREGPLPKNKLIRAFDEKYISEILENIEILKNAEVIEEFEYKGDVLLLLKTDIRFKTEFPQYLQKLISKRTRAKIARPYKPTKKNELDIGYIKKDMKTEEISHAEVYYSLEELKQLFGEPKQPYKDLPNLGNLVEQNFLLDLVKKNYVDDDINENTSKIGNINKLRKKSTESKLYKKDSEKINKRNQRGNLDE